MVFSGADRIPGTAKIYRTIQQDSVPKHWCTATEFGLSSQFGGGTLIDTREGPC